MVSSLQKWSSLVLEYLGVQRIATEQVRPYLVHILCAWLILAFEPLHEILN